MKRIASLLVVLCIAFSAQARDPAQVRHFRADHPCPATGKTFGACPGWVVDHKVPLCGGGVDAPINMQWQRYAESKQKDKRELAFCACLHRGGRQTCTMP